MLSESEIIEILKLELASSSNPLTDSSLEKALDYYLGNPRGDEVEGRSQVVSTDVADSIEWMMPQIMESFTANNEVVAFDPMGPNDEKQAALESEFTYSVLMKENEGYIALHQFFKDALLQNNGIIKVWFSDDQKQEVAQYTGILEPQLQMLAARDDVQILQLSDESFITPDGQSITQYNVSVAYNQRDPRIHVECVPPEQFRISNKHNSICVDEARFTAHIVSKTVSDLVEEGFDKDELYSLINDENLRSDYRFSAQNEDITNSKSDSPDRSMRLVEVAECYLKMDRNDDGIAERLKITVALQNEEPTKILSIEEIDEYPWVATTGILMSHKFKGLSIFDRIKALQDQKTALIRNILDNIYFINNQEWLIKEGRVELDDFLISRPGGFKRVQDMDAALPMQKQPMGPEPYNLLEYLDQVRAGRTGVSAEGSSAPQNIGQVGSEGVDRLMTAKEALCGLIVRTLAETGVKPLCVKIRDLAMKHMDVVKDFQFRGQWTQVSPKSWPPRSNCSVRVGTGTGDKQRQLGAINTVLQLQQQLAANPQTAVLVDLNKGYSAIDDFCKFAGLLGAERYFLDPSSPEGQQAQQASGQQQAQQAQQQQQIQAQQMQMEAQVAQSAVQTAQAELQSVQARFEADKMKAELQGRIKELEAQLKQMQHSVDTEFKYDELASNVALKIMDLQRSALEFNANQEAVENNLNDDGVAYESD